MQNFREQVNNLTTFGTTDDDALADWLKEGVAQIISILPKHIKQLCYTKVSFTSHAVGSETETIGDDVGDVFQGSYAARKIPASFKYKANDSGIYQATTTDPVYYIENSKINVLPASVSSVYNLLVLPTPGVTDSTIATFPNGLEYLVVLYASKKALIRLLEDKTLPSDLSVPVLVQVGTSLPTYSAPDSFVLIPPPAGADIDFSGISALSFPSVPIEPVDLNLTSLTISDLTISATVPVAPSIDIDTTSFSTAVPTYTAPVYSPNFSDIDNWITTEEDPELAAARVQSVQTQVQDFAARVQNELNSFQKESAQYQAELQVAIQDAQLASKFDDQSIQKYSAEVQTYTAEVQTSVQEYQANFAKELQIWQGTNANKIQQYQGNVQKYQAEIQKYSAEVGKEVQRYQTEIQKVVQKYQAETGYDMAKYQGELQAQVQKFTQDLSKETASYTSNLQKYQAEVQKISADNQSALGRFGQELANYSAQLQKEGMDYQWMQARLTFIENEYKQGLDLLINGGRAPQPAPPPQR